MYVHTYVYMYVHAHSGISTLSKQHIFFTTSMRLTTTAVHCFDWREINKLLKSPLTGF